MSMDDAAKKLQAGVRNEGAMQNVYRALEAMGLKSKPGAAVDRPETQPQGMSWEEYRRRSAKK